MMRFSAWNEQEYSVIPSFAVDASNAKRVNSAEVWATSAPGDAPPPIEVPNAPITGLRILSMEIRGHDGRAYKIISPEERLFDLREDVLLDAILNTGIKQGGVLPGHYVWVRYSGTNSKLVRLGSTILTSLVDDEKFLEWSESIEDVGDSALSRAEMLRGRSL